jgi:hypothetical protein
MQDYKEIFGVVARDLVWKDSKEMRYCGARKQVKV